MCVCILFFFFSHMLVKHSTIELDCPEVVLVILNGIWHVPTVDHKVAIVSMLKFGVHVTTS